MDIEALESLDERIGGLLALLRDDAAPGHLVDAAIRSLLPEVAGRDADRDWADDLRDAMSLIPYGGWFHWNHFGFSYVPTTVHGGGAFSNGADYMPDGWPHGGRPVSYEAMAMDSEAARARLPRLVCTAVALSWRTPVRKALARLRNRHYVVQTGKGPLVATPEGTLVPIPSGMFLTAAGAMVRHDEEVHGPGSVEVPLG